MRARAEIGAAATVALAIVAGAAAVLLAMGRPPICTGDSVINSLSDIACMAAGFWLARRLPVAASVALALALEALTLVVIRDNLTLNVLMLVWPLEAVRTWQGGS